MPPGPIFAFDHPHQPGEVCSHATCEESRKHPILAGSEEFEDIPMLIVRESNVQEYLAQPIQEGWTLPPPVYGCGYFYEISSD